MTAGELADILADVKFNDWRFRLGSMGDGFFVQPVFEAPDHVTGTIEVQRGRKWYVSRFATRPEVVQTCLKAVLAALEHEAREQFTYRGVAVFQPHIDLDALVDVARAQITRLQAEAEPPAYHPV